MSWTSARLVVITCTTLWASAAPLFGADDFGSLRAAFEKKEVDLAAGHQSAVLNLGVKYEGRIDQIIAERRKAGDEQGALAAESAKAQPKGAALEDGAPKALQAAHEIYRKAAAKLELEHEGRRHRLVTAYVKKLAEIQAGYADSGDQARAALVQREIDRHFVSASTKYTRGGGEHQKAVAQALAWLLQRQKRDGSWGETYPVSMTAFALLAYAGHAESLDSPGYGDSIRRGVDYLIKEARGAKGLMGKPGTHASYEHAIACCALAETYRQNLAHEEFAAKVGAQLGRSVPIIIRGQTKGGGWVYAYGKNGVGDLSVSSWNVQALKAAKLTGRTFKDIDKAVRAARDYIDEASTKTGLYRYRVTPQHRGRLSLTGAGVLAARLLGKPMGNEDLSFQAILAERLRGYRNLDLYATYYHAQACFLKGGQIWEEFKAARHDLIVRGQRENGSWPVAAGHLGPAAGDGVLYQTCLCTLILETSYRTARW